MERGVLVTVDLGETGGWTAGERSAELRDLARTAGVDVISEQVLKRREPVPASFLGKGRAEDLNDICTEQDIDIVVFNNDLSPSQQRNLERIVQTKTIDRTQLILDIFAQRAHSNEGKLQVELAQLLYNLPRLTGKGIVLSRLGGGIGTRGPGEQKLEMDRRRIRTRIAKLKNSLEKLSARRAMMRRHRARVAGLTIAIVGYTNVGKSTLLNALTRSHVVTEDKLFATLDPTARKFVLPDGQPVLFVDTVGFLQELPHHLIEAFKATLEEATDAELILHLVDLSHPKMQEQAESVRTTLLELGVGTTPVLTVLNKIDLVDAPAERAAAFADACLISAKTHRGFSDLIARVQAYLESSLVAVRLELGPERSDLISLVHESGVVDSKSYRGEVCVLEARVPERVRERLGEISRKSEVATSSASPPSGHLPRSGDVGSRKQA